MVMKVLVPLDGSDMADAVLAYIGELATRIGGEVILLKVLPDSGALPTTAHRQYNEARQHLDGMAQKLKRQGIEASTTIRYGKPVEETVDYARTNGVSLIAMSTHGRNGLRRWLFGSVAEKVLRSTALPVLLVQGPGFQPANSRSSNRGVSLGSSVEGLPRSNPPSPSNA
jgi:nucleotide-binding universal stress UspA family protein